MNILFICNKAEIGGAINSLLSLVVLLKKKGINPIMVTPNKNGIVKKFCRENNIQCYYSPYYRIGYAFNTSPLRKTIKLLLLPYYFLANKIVNRISLKILSKKINFKNISYIHTNVNRDDFGILLSKKFNIKHIMHLREYGTDDFQCKYLKRNIYKYFNDNTDIFIAISKSIKDFYIQKGINPSKIKVVYNGVDNHKIIRKKYVKTVNDKIKIIVLSGISKEKGQEQIIDAINLLDKKIIKNITIDFFGKGTNEYINYLKKKISNYKLNDNFNFIGYNNKVYELIQQYDIAITPSKKEAFGRVTIEYMFAGVPVIASDTGANPELINDNKYGLLYQYNNINDLKNKILLLYNDVKKREDLSEKAYNQAIKKFTSEQNAKTILKIYNGGYNEN